jgi:hypothetical protein
MARSPARLLETKVFSDGTPGDGKRVDIAFDSLPAETWDALMRTRPSPKKLAFDPPAADVHKREAGSPWRVKGEREVEVDNEEAKVRPSRSCTHRCRELRAA